MRRWELVAAGSAKFWEIGQSGVTVTVRFGRLGTAGQTKVKDLASEAAATAHVTKLIGEKQAKGYTETTAGTTAPTPAAPTAPESTVDAAQAVPADPSPAAEPGPTPVPEPAEDTFVLPDRWRAGIHPRRGGRTPATGKPAPKAAGHLRARLAADPDRLRKILEDRKTEPALAELVTEYLDGKVTPLGAAMCAAIRAHRLDGSPTEDGRLVADDWVLTHGLPFAAQAAVSLDLVEVKWRTKLGDDYLALQFTRPKVLHDRDHDTPIADRLRRLIAAGDEQDAVAEALAAHRTTLQTKLTASFLVPSRTDWIEEVITEAAAHTQNWASWRPLLASLGTVDQLDRVLALDQFTDDLRPPAVLRTVVDGIGPAVAPILMRVHDECASYDRDFRKLLLETIALLPSDEAFGLLADRVGHWHVESTVIETAKRFPRRALRTFAARTTDPVLRHLLHGHAQAHPELVPELPEELRAAVELVEAGYRQVEVADPAGLPTLLVSPPWTVERAPVKPVVLTGLKTPDDTAIVWQPGEREAWRDTKDTRFDQGDANWAKLVDAYRNDKISYHDEGTLFVHGPEELVRPLIAEWRLDYVWEVEVWGRVLVGRFELDALPAVLHMAKAQPAACGPLLLPYAHEQVAHLMADWLVRLKSMRVTATAWLRRHPDAAARYLVPTAVGAPGAARRNAEAALRLIPEQALAAAREHGPEAEAAVGTLVSVDPLEILPTKLPVPGEWADATLLPQILLADRQRALPLLSCGHVVTMLALSRLDDVYAGVQVVKDLCDPTSLAEFAWAVFERWKSVGMPSKDGFALTALGLLGDDAVARKLAPLIKVWPGESGHNRAVTGLDVLSAIGTDMALVQLNGIALKVKFKGLKQRAQDKIAAVAGELGLSSEQLADRLVPDFGLDDAATLVIDYGPRRFVVGFDEQLKPYVADEDGKRRKDLPKPGAKDDPELAPAEQKRFAALKKDVRSVAADQITRLEMAMVAGRTWTAAEYRELLAGHPLLWHIVRRLVWITTDGHSFRLAEDRTLADVNDDAYTLPDNTEVSLAHPLNLGDDLATWAEVFADYEILQPFPQLGRPVHQLTDAERAAGRLERFENTKVPVGKLLGLTKRGWERGVPQDGGAECWILRPLPDGGAVVANLSPGIAVGVVDMFPEQTLTEIWVNGDGIGNWWARSSRTFGDLDPVTASELLAELTSLSS